LVCTSPGPANRRSESPAFDLLLLYFQHRLGRSLAAVDDTSQQLERVNPRKAEIVELKFFGGLTVEETAEVMTISPQTVIRGWKMARSWLMSELTQ